MNWWDAVLSELQPREFDHSEACYRLLCLVTVKQQDFGVRYSPARARPRDEVIEPNETFFADAQRKIENFYNRFNK